MIRAYVIVGFLGLLICALMPDAKPPQPAKPIITSETRARFWRAALELNQAAASLKDAQQKFDQVKVEMVAQCGDYGLVQDARTGEPACGEKPPEPSKK